MGNSGQKQLQHSVMRFDSSDNAYISYGNTIYYKSCSFTDGIKGSEPVNLDVENAEVVVCLGKEGTIIDFVLSAGPRADIYAITSYGRLIKVSPKDGLVKRIFISEPHHSGYSSRHHQYSSTSTSSSSSTSSNAYLTSMSLTGTSSSSMSSNTGRGRRLRSIGLCWWGATSHRFFQSPNSTASTPSSLNNQPDLTLYLLDNGRNEIIVLRHMANSDSWQEETIPLAAKRYYTSIKVLRDSATVRSDNFASSSGRRNGAGGRGGGLGVTILVSDTEGITAIRSTAGFDTAHRGKLRFYVKGVVNIDADTGCGMFAVSTVIRKTDRRKSHKVVAISTAFGNEEGREKKIYVDGGRWDKRDGDISARICVSRKGDVFLIADHASTKKGVGRSLRLWRLSFAQQPSPLQEARSRHSMEVTLSSPDTFSADTFPLVELNPNNDACVCVDELASGEQITSYIPSEDEVRVRRRRSLPSMVRYNTSAAYYSEPPPPTTAAVHTPVFAQATPVLTHHHSHHTQFSHHHYYHHPSPHPLMHSSTIPDHLHGNANSRHAVTPGRGGKAEGSSTSSFHAIAPNSVVSSSVAVTQTTMATATATATATPFWPVLDVEAEAHPAPSAPSFEQVYIHTPPALHSPDGFSIASPERGSIILTPTHQIRRHHHFFPMQHDVDVIHLQQHPFTATVTTPTLVSSVSPVFRGIITEDEVYQPPLIPNNSGWRYA